MVTVHYMPSALKARGIAFNPRGMTITGPVSLSGRSQVAAYDAGYWMATLDVATLGQGDDVLAFRALRAEMEGGANHVLVPAFDQGQAPWPAAGGQAANENDDIAWSDGVFFSDGSGWFKPAIIVNVAADAALRATSLVVDIVTAGTLKAGMYFSLVGGGMHVIRSILASSGSQRTLHIWPPLRAPAITGRRCEFERPVCRMRLVSDQEADLALGRLWMAQPSMTFVEAFEES